MKWWIIHLGLLLMFLLFHFGLLEEDKEAKATNSASKRQGMEQGPVQQLLRRTWQVAAPKSQFGAECNPLLPETRQNKKEGICMDVRLWDYANPTPPSCM